MELSEIEEVLGCFSALRAPENLLVVTEPVTERVDGLAYFRGLSPKHRNDTIVITPQATPETVVHETLHAQFGLGELATYPLAKAWVQKYFLTRFLPVLGGRKVKYQRCAGCEDFRLLHERYAGRAEHYIKA